MANNGGNRTSTGVPVVPNIPRRPPSWANFGFETIVNDEIASRSVEPRPSDIGSKTIVDEKLGSKDRSRRSSWEDFGFETIVNDEIASRRAEPRPSDLGSETIVDEKLASKEPR
ncbi:hypothetical protein DEO72_LG8g1721 [Vigna unguiculata]|uniref:Uncharacterized protein n=1 Tax=Vigna unguiculata TaxID=3917 RepID=A0A4D6MQD2_VIGUN|nr:hypothetical protein DEO72_LG8g1721 [Vigna unguiculata]